MKNPQVLTVSTSQNEDGIASYRWHILAMLALVMLDAFFLPPAFGILGTVFMAVIAFITCFITLMQKPAMARRPLIRGLIYALGVFLIFTSLQFHEWTGNRNAQKIITAVETHYLKYGDFPEQLEELVPTQLDAIPRSAYRRQGNQYFYSNRADGRVTLVWYPAPPSIYMEYDFLTRDWNRSVL